MTGTDGRKPTPLEHIYFNRPELLQNKKIEFYVHNYNDSTKRKTNEFKLAAFNSTGQLIWPQGSNAPYCGTITGNKAKTQIFSFNFDASNLGATVNAGGKAAAMGVPLWNTKSLKNGDYLSTVNYWRSVGGSKFMGVDGAENTIPNNLLARDFWSADHFDKQIKCSATDLVNILSRCQDCIF